MSRVETEEIPKFRIGRVRLTATELAGLAEYEAAARRGAWKVEDSQEGEDLPTIFYAGRKPTRQRFALRHGTKPDPETGMIILTKIPHRHTSCEVGVARYRRFVRGIFFRGEKPHIPGWRVRAPEISDWDTLE